MRRIMLTFAAVLLVASQVRAQPIDQREENQQHRIDQGVKKGKLTPQEAERLENEQKTIQDEKARAMEDGKMTKGERREIKHDQKKASHDIHRKKHNAKNER